MDRLTKFLITKTRKNFSSSSLTLLVAIFLLIGIYGCSTKYSKLEINELTILDLAVNDISYLWPVPSTQEEVDQLIDGESVWLDASFKAALEVILKAKVKNAFGDSKQIIFPPSADFHNRVTWKLVGFRVDPSAPSTDISVIKQFGSIPQIRLIMQPVTFKANTVTVHDYTAHLAFNFTLNNSPPFLPDHQKFAAILGDLLELKEFLLAESPSISTNGQLRINPGLEQYVPDFSKKVESFLLKYISGKSPDIIAFMGIPDPQPEPWIFLEFNSASEILISEQSLHGQMFSPLINVLDGPVTPVPNNSNLETKPPVGVSTAVLFKPNIDLNDPAVKGRSVPLIKDIPDIIANPINSNVLNTDCFSCHSETTRRTLLKIAPTPYQFDLDGTPGVEPSMLPDTNYNVRNFGWYQLGVDKPKPAISMRAGNETANALMFIHKEY